jgi:hypothetical protein
VRTKFDLDRQTSVLEGIYDEVVAESATRLVERCIEPDGIVLGSR